MTDPWIIIGWVILFVLIIVPLALSVVQLKRLVVKQITFRTTWNDQAGFRSKPPERHQIWKSARTNKEHYITKGPTEFDHGVEVSTDDNSNGSVYYTLKEWSELVKRERLIKMSEL